MASVSSLKFIFSFSSKNYFLGNSPVCTYLYDYLKVIKAETCIFEKDYIDRDYLIDYAKFYARSFENYYRKTERYHFFSIKFTQKKFLDALNTGDKQFFKSLQKAYLGFVVLKPITDLLGYKLVGRTLLATYPEKDNGERRVFLKNKHHVSLFGIPLTIETLPFQQKDMAVGACATITCWCSLFPLMNLFGTPTLSPFEVTERSTVFPSDARNFPSEGLTLYQMKQYFSSLGLETEFIDPNISFPSLKSDDDVVADVVRAYNELGLPVIASLNITESDDYHAVLISGYRHSFGILKEIYVHDDNVGPYHRIKQNENGKFYSWSEPSQSADEKEYEVKRLLVPVYPKIRLNFPSIYAVYLRYKRSTEAQVTSKNLPDGSQAELFLTDIRRYKSDLIKRTFDDKVKVLLDLAPRFIWVIRIHKKHMPIFDYYFDGTAINPKDSKSIRFDN